VETALVTKISDPAY